MNDKELADAVKELLNISPFDDFPVDAAMVRNWKYAGALMEKFNYYELIELIISTGKPGYKQEAHLAKITPRAIIEACVEALS